MQRTKLYANELNKDENITLNLRGLNQSIVAVKEHKNINVA